MDNGLKNEKRYMYDVSVNNLHYSYVAPTTLRQPSLAFCDTPLPRLLKWGVFAKMRKRGGLLYIKNYPFGIGRSKPLPYV